MTDPTPRAFASPSVTSCTSVEWRKSSRGGEARLVDGILIRSYGPNEVHFDYICGEPLTDWIDCPNPHDAEAVVRASPAPDYIVEPRPPASA
jgi:hypothetical protein